MFGLSLLAPSTLVMALVSNSYHVLTFAFDLDRNKTASETINTINGLTSDELVQKTWILIGTLLFIIVFCYICRSWKESTQIRVAFWFSIVLSLLMVAFSCWRFIFRGDVDHLTADTGRTDNIDEEPPSYEEAEKEFLPYAEWGVVRWVPGLARQLSRDITWGRMPTVCEINV